ncbi:MAG: flagellar basal body rod protein FlgB [Bacillota bacterium]
MFEKLTGSLRLREKALDAAWLRNEVIAHNIANVDTPGFKKSTVEFEEHLENALGSGSFKGFTTDSRHIKIGSGDADSVKIRVTKNYRNLSTRLDGNNVDIDSEMASLAKNNIRYNTLVQSISSGYQRLLSVISEGRK